MIAILKIVFISAILIFIPTWILFGLFGAVQFMCGVATLIGLVWVVALATRVF